MKTAGRPTKRSVTCYTYYTSFQWFNAIGTIFHSLSTFSPDQLQLQLPVNGNGNPFGIRQLDRHQQSIQIR